MAYMTNFSEIGKARAGVFIIIKRALEYKQKVIAIGTLGLLTATLSVSGPLIMSRFIDYLTLAISKDSYSFTWASTPTYLLATYVAIKFLAVCINWFSDRIARRLSLEVYTKYTTEIFNNLLHYPVSFFESARMGKVYEVSGRASNALQNLIGFQFPYLGVQLLSIIFSLGILAVFSFLIFSVIVLGLVIYFLMMLHIVPSLTKATEQASKANNKAYENYYEIMGNVPEVKKNNTVDLELSRIEKLFTRQVLPTQTKEQFFWVNAGSYKSLITNGTTGVALGVSMYLVFKGQMSIGELTAVSFYIMNIFQPLDWLSNMWLYLQGSAIKVKEAEDLFNKKPEQELLDSPLLRPEIKGNILFKDVSFAYNKKDGKVLEGISIDSGIGKATALVGKSGSGKSTLVELVGGFYFPQKGEVLIDGVSTKDIDLKYLRSQVAYVSQEVTLFNDTVAKNIAYGAGRKVSQAEIEEVARQAHCHEFIMDFTKGYKQIVGERGVKLSVGQKQRIAIARAILRNPKILILDEPTSALDAESEKHITKSLASLMQGRTTFIIAHRLSTVREADTIIVLEKGEIKEQGTHRELVNKAGGIYQEFYSMQLGFY